jgi:Protein of unknown function (DUF3606)
MRSCNSNRLSLTDQAEVQYWTEVLGLSPVKLEAEIKKHRNSAWLGRCRPPRPGESPPDGREMVAQHVPNKTSNLPPRDRGRLKQQIAEPAT